MFLSDETWFHLRGHVLIQNHRYWGANKPNFIHETPLHDEKIGIWCAVNVYCLIGSIFYETTINTQRYRDDILTPFFE